LSFRFHGYKVNLFTRGIRQNKWEDLPDDPQVIANEYLTDYTHPLTGETYKYLNLPMQFRETPATRRGRAPLLGEHTEEILVDILGYWMR